MIWNVGCPVVFSGNLRAPGSGFVRACNQNCTVMFHLQIVNVYRQFIYK